MRSDELVDLIWSKYKYDEGELTKSTIAAIVDDVLGALKIRLLPDQQINIPSMPASLSELFIAAEGGLPPPRTKKPATGKRRR